MKMIYLATPYSHKGLLGRWVMWMRFRIVTRIAAKIMQKGYNVFSPITLTHPIARLGNIDQIDHEFWLKMDKWYVDRCDELWVVMLDGWKDSAGVKREIGWALWQGKGVFGLDIKGNVQTWITKVP
jgi:hypothetical protein